MGQGAGHRDQGPRPGPGGHRGKIPPGIRTVTRHWPQLRLDTHRHGDYLLITTFHEVSAGTRSLILSMPCMPISADGIAVGPVATFQSRYHDWGRLARSGGIWVHTGRPPARCLWVRSFSGGPRSEPDGHLSAHPALQRFPRAVPGWLPPAAGTQDFRHRFGVVHYAYLPVRRNPSTAWPPSPCGRLSRPPWRGVTPATTTGPLSPRDSRPRR